MAESNANVTNRNNITNPYTRENRAQYKMGTVEQFLHDKLGFRTGYDQYHEQMDNAMNEWETQNQSLGYEEEYNSPEAQTERMKNAGLNPDIAPNQITPGEAGEMTEPESVPNSPAGTDMETLQAGAEHVAKIGMAIMGMVSDAEAMTLQVGAKELQDMDIAENMLGLVDESMGYFEELPGAGEFSGKVTDEGTKALAKMLGMSKRNTKRFQEARKSYMNSVPGRMRARERARQNKENETLYKIADTVNEHTVKTAENQLQMESRLNELMQKYPKLVDNSIIANWKKGIFEASKMGAEAGIAQENEAILKAEGEARKIYGEYKEIQAKDDVETLNKYKKILENGNYMGKPGDVVKFHIMDRKKRNAERRAYGRTSEGIEDYAKDIVDIF